MDVMGIGRVLQITETIRERELAALAGLMAEHQKLAEKQRSVAQAMHEALQLAQNGLADARQAESFARWVSGQHDEIQLELARLIPLIHDQKERTAKAVGRHETLGTLEQRLRRDLQKKKGRQQGIY